MSSFMNIGRNVVAPFNLQQEGQLAGALSVVSSEVIVSKFVRMFMGDKKGVLELAYIHALSLPFLGGLQFGEPSDRISAGGSSYPNQLARGAKGIPAVILAQYLVNTFTTGFHVPWFNMKDLLITAACKAITTPMLFAARTWLPDMMTNGLEIMQLLEQQQEGASFGGKSGDTSPVLK